MRDPQRRTLLACSGGADSSALVIAMGSASRAVRASVVVGHVVHDLREPADTRADRDAARTLAGTFGLPFVETSVAIRSQRGNAEGLARDARYGALQQLAIDNACRFVAVAHQGDDSLETLLLRLMRGAGPLGLAGVRPIRMLDNNLAIVRPMLTLGREDSERLCSLAGWKWRHDATNDDTTRLRAALRATVTPALRALCPTIHERAANSARLFEEYSEVVSQLSNEVAGAGMVEEGTTPSAAWARGTLRATSPVVVGEAIRATILKLTTGKNADRLSYEAVTAVTKAILDESTEPRSIGLAGCVIKLTSRRVEISRAR